MPGIKALANIPRVLKENVIKVKKIQNHLYEVSVSKDGHTIHHVSLYTTDYENFSQGRVEEIELIEASFRFLLDRESNQSILKEFNLNVIQKYFPEYPNTINSYF